MDTHSIRVSYRPIRIGWCIKTDNIEDLRTAMRLTHSFWGGRYNPLIPIDDPKFAKSLIDVFRVDVLFPVSDDQEINDFIESYKYLPWPFISSKPEVFINSEGKKKSTLLDISHPVNHLYKKYIHKVATPNIHVCIYEWEMDDPLADIFLATLGAFPVDGNIEPDYEKLIENSLKAERQPIDKDKSVPIDIYDKVTINYITSYDLKYIRPFGWNNPGFYVGDAHNPNDILTFWNLRASASRLIFYDPNYSDRLDLLKDKELDLVKDRPTDPERFDESIAIWTHEKNKDNLDLSPFGDERKSQCTASTTAWNGLNVKPPFLFFDNQSVLGSLSRDTTPSLSFQLPSKPFFDDRRSYSQHAIASIHPIIDISDEELTFFAPDLPELNEFYGRNYHFIWNKVRIEKEGIGIVIRLHEDQLTLHAIKVHELIEKIFSVYEMTSKPSQAGLLGKRLIKQMEGLQGCRVFKIKGVRELIEKYNPYQSFTRSAANQIIGQIDPGSGRPNFSKYENLVIEYDPSRKKLNPDKTFTYLIKKGVFRVGLKFSCTNCELEFWKHLDDVKTTTICEYCGSDVNVSPQLKDRDWAYRRSGIFGRDDHQEGGIPVAVTLQQLETTLHHKIIAYSTALEISSKDVNINKCETDFAGYCKRI